jgi:hypothetical protein
MNFLQFQQTKKVIESLWTLHYLNIEDDLFITSNGESYLLVIGNTNYQSTELRHLELLLYYYCCGESYFGQTLQLIEVLRDHLINELQTMERNGTFSDLYSINEGLEPMSLIDALIKYDEFMAE